jgi:phage virion morphogenesis protein
MEIRFELDDSLTPALARAVEAATDFTPAMKSIADLMEEATRRRIEETNVGPDGVPWLPSRRVIDDGGKTLVDTGRNLLASIASAFTATEAVAGTNWQPAKIHQFGGTIRPREKKALNTPFGFRASVTMPARPFLGFGPVEQEEIPAILRDHLVTAFSGGAA